MAAVTETGNRDLDVLGSAVQVRYPDIDIANTGDTLEVADLTTILGAYTNKPGSVTAMAFSGNVITFTTGGAVADVNLVVVGYQ